VKVREGDGGIREGEGWGRGIIHGGRHSFERGRRILGENSESWTRERFVFGIYTLDRGC